MTCVTTSVSHPGISTPRPTQLLLLPAQISLVIRPSTLPLSDLSNHPGERVKSQPLLPAVHPTHPLRSPPPAQGVDFWKCTSADYTPVYRKPTLQ